MRRISSEEGWRFGSRRLARLMTVLALISALLLVFSLWWWSAPNEPVDTSVSYEGSNVSVMVSEDPNSKPDATSTADVADPEVPTETTQAQLQDGTPDVADPLRPAAPRSAPTPRPQPSASTQPTLQASVRPTIAADAEIAATPAVPGRIEVEVPAASVRSEASESTNLKSPDQIQPTVVERRDTRRQVRETVDAIRDIRPR